MAPSSMKAVIFDGPGKISVQERPLPELLTEDDMIVKVQSTAICGSELHVYRGHQPSATGFIMGHEFTGLVDKVGGNVRAFQPGDKVVCPFTVSCLQCFYCKQGHTSRCAKSLLFGSPPLDGGQAEYVRVPNAEGTAVKAPEGVSDNALVLMADIWPTGFFGARSAFQLLRDQSPEEATIVVVGCGPVGLCAIIAALDHKPRRIFAVDSVPSRLDLAKALGAEPLNFENGMVDLLGKVRAATSGRGADAVVEVVGLSPALRTAFDLVRPFGVISSIGVHNSEIPWTGNEAYSKNLTIQMGRCPVRGIFPEALHMLQRKQHLLGFMFDKIMPLSDAVEGYNLFDQKRVQKVIFQL